MRSVLPVSALRPAKTLTNCHPHLVAAHLFQRRYYASTGGSNSGASSASSKRRAVTPFNDDGHVPWTDLSGAEKTARAAQQTFNFGFIIVGVVLTGGVGYFLWTEVFSTESKVTYFNRAVNRIKSDRRCLELLGDSKKITAHGEETYNKWRRARPISSTERTDQQGNHHLIMQFYVEGPLNRGSVHIHLIKHVGHGEYEYKYFYVDIRGQQRIYLENDSASSQQGGGGKGTKLFGIKWS
ncbi:TIM21-domain-containing protein [Cryphonectria parasitica EP155]|uniref:Mitochondrial import inner membrane translocase subunit Tim21 n=1 Tax=Cryphonectria parasitica (strain ATCC 38755 / EP155) TaxID=660469 RepID=A0A9P4Y620_CRYP1|nr:TIM21-domain-containing protein [Cryphonectria parasitica EP155]KAF3767634.1 TIM21-domain-containing protein [Cryphonectria parasitica EP155]